MYTHDRLWPAMSDLSQHLRSHCQILDSNSGGSCFDESCMNIWASLADKYPEYPIPLACSASTVELRGELDVSDELASNDALNLYKFLQGRGFIQQDVIPLPIPPLLRAPCPLTGMDMIKAEVTGVTVWYVKIGDIVKEGDLLGYIIDIVNVDAPRTPVITRASGLVYGIRPPRLVKPGQIIIKVAGDKPLPWRTGNLLTP